MCSPFFYIYVSFLQIICIFIYGILGSALVHGQKINKKLSSVTVFIILICFSRKRGFQAFIFVYYKSFDKHRCSSPTGSFYAFCTNFSLIRGCGTSIV